MKQEMEVNHKKIRVLHHWPLSKVELVEINNKKYILKTVHEDFRDEISKQKLLGKKCKKIDIPKIHYTSKGDGTVSFLMDYIPSKKKEIGLKTALEMISIFHKETRNIKSKHFRRYDFDAFWQDFRLVRKYLGDGLKRKNKAEIKDYFKEVFSSKYSVVHGDWGTDQIVGQDKKYHIVDFGKSYYGPSILDYAQLILKKKRINKLVYTYIPKNEKMLLKARIIACIITLSWTDLCSKKYIPYDYTQKIKE